MGERTLVVTMSLPIGRDWMWFADLNMVGLSDRLDELGRECAMTAFQCWWRRTCLQTLRSDTQPIPAHSHRPIGQLTPLR